MNTLAGFTVLEMLIVVLVVAIIGVVALPMMEEAVAESKLSKAASEAITALEFAQMTAMSSGNDTRVIFDTAGDWIAVRQFTLSTDLAASVLKKMNETAVESGAFAPIPHPLNPGKNYRIELAERTWFGGIDITSATFGGNNRVTFNALGTPSSPGTVTMVYGSRQIVLTLAAFTGKVTLSN
jgi:type II secretory pathway pseudopilin PulG